MKKQPSRKTEAALLRRQAEQRLAQKRKQRPVGRTSAETKLLHELDTHKIELEMQNDQLRAAQIDLEAGLDRYTQLFDFAPIGYATLSRDGTVQEVNHVGASLLGEIRRRVIGRRFAVFVASSDRRRFDEMLEQVLEDDVKRTIEVDLMPSTKVDLTRSCIRLTAASLAAKRPTVLLAFEDVTAQRNTQERLRRADEQLREADRRKDEFLAVLSHELRTPLSSILMHGQLLQQGGMDEDDVRSSGEVIERASKAQVRLIEDLLDVSRIIAGKLSLSRDPVSLVATVQAAVDAVSSEARKKNIGLTVDTDPTVPEVLGDSTRLQQVVSNLLTNAIKFTPEHGRVHLTLDEVFGNVRIEVRDSGIGIDPAFLPRLFERFSQADRTTTRSSSGLGLGLSIVHSIVDAHHGVVRAESEGQGKGSTFTILLPAMGGASETKGRSPAAPAKAPMDIKGARLLLVEDDLGTRITIARVLESAGAEVRDAESAQAAMKLLADFKPDVLVCDIGMPMEDGCTFLRRIRSREAKAGGHLPALALTAFGGAESLARTRAAGFQEHLVKPVDIDRLLTTVSRLLSVKGAAARLH